MQEKKLVRTFVEVLCPHCSQTSIVSVRTFSPIVDWNLKREDLEKAKAQVVNGIQTSEYIPAEQKKELLEYFQSENVFIGPDEVEPVLKQIYLDNHKQDDTAEN